MRNTNTIFIIIAAIFSIIVAMSFSKRRNSRTPKMNFRELYHDNFCNCDVELF